MAHVPVVAPNERGPLGSLLRFLRRHPIVLLLALTPGIPEYLSGSSNLTGLLWNPLVFLIFLALNLAMYGPGVLLIREAMVRWGGGWGTVAVLGAAYATLEEGIADATFFNPHNPNVGVLGSYGHFLGTNWVWIPGVVMVHVVFSIAIPIFLWGTAFPGLRHRRLLTGRQTALVFALLGADILAVGAIGAGYVHWVDTPLQISACLAVIAAGYLIARSLPPGWPQPPAAAPRAAPVASAVLGLALFPSVILVEGLLGTLGVPAALTFLAVVVLLIGYAVALYSLVGRQGHTAQVLAFAAGAIVPIAIVGAVSGFPVPLALGADLLAYLFFRRLWGRAGPEDPAHSGDRQLTAGIGVQAAEGGT